jgi:hypothetical protein
VTLVEVVVGALATYRLLLLLQYDRITEGLVESLILRANRRKHPDMVRSVSRHEVLMNRATNPHWIVNWLDCPWCGAVPIAGLVMATGWFWGTDWFWFIPASILAASGVASMLTELARPSDREYQRLSERDDEPVPGA